MISIICAVGKNLAIGYKNKLLWDIPEDLAYFRKRTWGHTVIMGKKTFESIGKPLPGRNNVIVTRDKKYRAQGCEVSNSLEKMVLWARKQPEEVFIIGGGQIYKQALPFAQKLYLTEVDDAPKADTFFPDFKKDFVEIERSNKKRSKDLEFCFVVYERKE